MSVFLAARVCLSCGAEKRVVRALGLTLTVCDECAPVLASSSVASLMERA